jgi:shikimate 5-dehydrogenase
MNLGEVADVTPPPATVFFLGVTTAASGAARLFPRWMEALGIEALLEGVDIPLGAPAHRYRRFVRRLEGEGTAGAVITSHKLDLYRSCRYLLTPADPLVEILGEVACILPRTNGLAAHTIDPLSSRRALHEMLKARSGKITEALVLGAGGAGLAVVLALPELSEGRVTLADTRLDRLEHASQALDRLPQSTSITTAAIPLGGDADDLVGSLSPGSVIVNATGLGKDVPGSPVTDAVSWPEGSLLWDLNYRGELTMLKQAGGRATERSLEIHDGWRLFLHGWALALSLLFDLEVFADDLDGASCGP